MLHGRFFNKNDKTNIRKILDRTSTLNLQECRSYIQASYDSMHRLHESDERIADDYKPLFDYLDSLGARDISSTEKQQDLYNDLDCIRDIIASDMHQAYQADGYGSTRYEDQEILDMLLEKSNRELMLYPAIIWSTHWSKSKTNKKMYALRDKLRKEYDNYPEKYNIPEKREVLLANFNDREEAQSIANKIQDLDTDASISKIFIEIIKENTELDPNSVNLGLIEYNDFPSEVSDSIFKTEANILIGPEKTAFGWRLFLVTNIKPAVNKTFQDVKTDIEKELKVSIAIEKMYDLGNTFYDEIAAGNQIEQAALSIGAKVEEFKYIDVNGIDQNGNVVNNIPPYPELLDTVFSYNNNETSELINTIGNTMYAIQVNDILDKRIMTLEEARNKVIEDINLEKSMELALNNATNFSKELNNGNFEKIAEKYNLIVLEANNVSRDGAGAEGILDNESLREAFNIKKGETSSPKKYKNENYLIINVTEILPVIDRNNDQLIRINSEISQSISRDIEQLFINNLTSNQKIKINENLLNSLFQNDS